MYCLDRKSEPSKEFHQAKEQYVGRVEGSGTIEYRRVDVQDANDLDTVISDIASQHGRMDGLIAAAGVQNVTPALDYPPEKITEVS